MSLPQRRLFGCNLSFQWGLVYSTSSTLSRQATSADVSGLIAGATVNPANLNNTIYAAGVNGAGIGVAQTAWSSSLSYPQCAAVAASGLNYLAVAANAGVVPGTNSAIWCRCRIVIRRAMGIAHFILRRRR